MIISINIDTQDALSERERVVLLALAGEINLGEAAEPRFLPPLSDQDVEEAAEEAQPTLDAIAEVAEEVSEAITAEEPKKRARVVNVSDASLKKYDFHRTEDGEIVCDHCDHVSETGRALHLHAGTHSDVKEDAAPAKEKALRSVPTPKEPEAGVDALLSTEPTKEDAEPEPEPVEAKVVETDPKVLRDMVAKVATEMVAAEKQAEIRKVLDDVLGGVARVSMIEEKDLQKFLDAEPIAAFIAKKAG